MKHIAFLCVLVSALAGAQTADSTTRARKIVLLAGQKSHSPGEHEYLATMKLIKLLLERSSNVKGVNAEIFPNGWPDDPKELDDADTIVVMSDGQDHDTPTRVPFMTEDRMKIMEKEMNRGCGLVMIHYSTFISFPYDGQTLEWNGGYYNWDENRGPVSKIKTISADVALASPSHAIVNGVTPFHLRDEFYYNIKFRENDPRLMPILRVPQLSSEPQQQTVAWAVQRDNGARGFGITMGHYFQSWKDDNYRRMMLNAIVWTAGGTVPPEGVQSRFDEAEDLPQSIVVDAAPSHAVNSFSPMRALGGSIDRLRGGPTKEENEKHTERLLTNPILKEMLGAGWQTVTYRQNTELMIEAWHWNARGTWSNAAKKEGYFTGSAEPTNEKILHSWAYPLPHRGATEGDGNGWSRLTDGDLKSYWKSNPYLSKPYTADEDSLHPQWVMIDLGAKVDVNAVKIAWANPYAKRYSVQFWTGEKEPFYDGINKGTWQTFPTGAITDGKGGTPTLKLVSWNIPVRYLRIWMTESSNTCDTHGAEDRRNCLGYAINELYIGTMSADRHFTDIVKHLPSRQQTITWPSSVDPWHAASDLDYGRGDQIGFDFFFNCGVTRGLPAMIPIAILYNNPQDAANEIAYLYKRKYPISWIEMGEEADGQRVLPEDYATLYIQFAKAIHKLVPEARLGGPSFEGTPGDVDSWADSNGRVSFLGRFVDYLKARGHLGDFRFFSFEHYPCGAGGGEGRKCADWSSLYWEPSYVNHVVQAWKDNGLPSNVPFFMTEGNDLEEGGPGTVKSGLWLADYVGSMLTAGAGGTYYFHYITSIGEGGDGGFLHVDENNQVTNYPPQYLATQVITKEWVQPVDAFHKLFKVASGVKDDDGNTLVTAYAVERPDGQWSVMLVNKDQDHDHSVKLTFADPVARHDRVFSGTVDRVVFGAAEYEWHPDPASPDPQPNSGQPGRRRQRRSGHAAPDGPPSTSTVTAADPDTLYRLPKASIIVLRGKLAN